MSPIVTECRRHRVLIPVGKTCPQCTNERNAQPNRLAHRTVRHARIRKAAFRRDGFTCVYCGATEGLTADYVVPLARGGEMTLSNAVTACRPCNSRGGADMTNGTR